MWAKIGDVMVSETGQVMKNGQLLSQYDSNGYKAVQFGQKRIGVHRLVAMAFIPNPESKPQVNHKDGNKANNHVSNLEWVTGSENMVHAYNHGLVKKRGDVQHDVLYYNLEAERARKRWSIDVAAKKLGISNKTYRHLLSEGTSMKLRRLLAFANLYGCSVDYLLGLSDKIKIEQ